MVARLPRSTVLLGPSIAIGVVVVLVLGVLAAPASAEELNVSGTWDAVYHCEAGGCAGSNYPATAVLYQAPGSTHVSSPPDVEGTLNGNVLTLEGGSNGYHFVEHVTISADGKTWSGPLSDNNGTSGTDTATRVSGGSGEPAPPAAPPAPVDSRHPTATELNCGFQPLRATDICSATVRDAATSAPTTPTGAVTLNAGGGKSGNGVFPAGSTCLLAGAGPPGLATCTVEYIPPTFGLTKLQADYAGDATHASSSTGTPPCAAAKPSAQPVKCASSAAGGGVCKPTGSVSPQCSQPTVIPVACSTQALGSTCQAAENYVLACGGLGTILPACNPAPASIPQVCGPKTSGLPACTSANNTITVCGAKSAGLPQCSFATDVTGASLNAASSTGEVDVTVGCAQADTTGAFQQPAIRRAGGAAASAAKRACSPEIATLDYLSAQRLAIAPAAIRLEKTYRGQAFLQGGRVPGADDQYRSPETVEKINELYRYGEHNAVVSRKRTSFEEGTHLNLGDIRAASSLADLESALSLYQYATRERSAEGNYVGPRGLFAVSPSPRSHSGDLESVPEDEAPSVESNADLWCFELHRAQEEAFKLLHGAPKAEPIAGQQSYRPGDVRLRRRLNESAPTRNLAKDVAAEPRVHHLRIAAGGRARIRLRLPHRLVRRLLHSAGKGASVAPVRLVVAYRASPRPVVRFIDFHARIVR